MAGSYSPMIFQEGRLGSFNKTWPHSDQSLCSREQMARAGFFYAGYSDCVKCFVCHIRLNDWNPENDNPMTKHRECAPNCMFASFGKPEAELTVEEWCDVMCAKAINNLDQKFMQLSKLLAETQ